MADEAKHPDNDIASAEPSVEPALEPSAEPTSEKIDSIVIEPSTMAYEPPSPLTGCYILIILGEPHSDEHKDIILQRLLKGKLTQSITDILWRLFVAFDKSARLLEYEVDETILLSISPIHHDRHPSIRFLCVGILFSFPLWDSDQ